MTTAGVVMPAVVIAGAAVAATSHAHKCRRLCVWCLLQTVGFPIEHLMWEKAPLLSSLTHVLGL